MASKDQQADRKGEEITSKPGEHAPTDTEFGRREAVEHLCTIRDLMASAEERVLFEPWALYMWGVVVFVATLIHAAAAATVEIAAIALAARVWVPAIVVGSFCELIAWKQALEREETPIFAKRFLRLLFSFLGVFVVLVAIVLWMFAQGALSPGVLLLCWSLAVLILAHASYLALFVEGYIGLAVAIIMLAAGFSGTAAYVAVGVFAAAMFAVIGAHIQVLMRKSSS